MKTELDKIREAILKLAECIDVIEYQPDRLPKFRTRKTLIEEILNERKSNV